jgi:molybdate transport system ATP-binding protein
MQAHRDAGCERPIDGRQALVTVCGISIRAGEQLVFPNTSWVLFRGEPWAVVGPNGSGKSLLARALCGQALVVEGRLCYHFLAGSEDRDARCGWFPKGSVIRVSADDHHGLAQQHGRFHQARWHAAESEGATVRELLTRQSVEAINPYEVLPEPDDPGDFGERMSRAIRLFGLEALLERRVLELSSGETRKLVLTRAVARGPKLLVLDEPFAGLDLESREVLRSALDALAAAGMGLVVATSRPEELPSCVRRALLVREHRVIAEIDRAQAERLLRGAAVAAPAPIAPAPTARTGEPLLDLREVTVRYGSTTILDRVSLRIEPGEHWTISGPNGAGKSTLLSLILGDNPQAYANYVEVLGRRRGEGESIWDMRAKIGWVSPEIHAHYPMGARALDVVGSGFFASVGLWADLGTEQRARARSCLARLLPGCADRTLAELSYGMQRLVLIARALVTDPPLLILDEPCQGLDAAARGRVLEAVDGAARSGRTALIFVTHQADELPGSISHVLELRAGRVVRKGPRCEAGSP